MFARGKLMWMVALVTILSLMGVASAVAQSTPGSGPSAAAWNETGLVTLKPGQEHFYTFLSAFADPQARDAQFTVMAASKPQGTVMFDVWTPDGLRRAAAGETGSNARPIGSGTLHPVKDGDGTHDRYGGIPEWTGGSGRPQAYVIQLKSKDSSPVQYNLTVDGHYIQFPDGTLAGQASRQGMPAPQPTAQPTTSMTAKAAASPQPAAASTTAGNQPPASQPAGPVAGSSPDTALPLDDATHQIKPGESQWYVLNYPGQLKNGDIPSGTVVLTAQPYGSANFKIWTGDRLRALALGDLKAGVPVGGGTLHPINREGVLLDRWDGNPAWTNRSSTPGTFLIEVQPAQGIPSSYTFSYIQE